MKKIFVTGGHYAPAKAVISRLSGWEIFYVGRKYAMEDDRAEALEYREFKHLNYLVITTGRLQRKFFVNVGQSVKSLFKIPIGFIQSFRWLLKYQPDAVLSFGGYVAVPVVFAAWLLDVPVVTHEQTKSVGLANRIIRFLGAKVLETGNPLREEILKQKPTDQNILYITGGNQGAHVLNLAVFDAIKNLNKYKILHQTGDSVFNDFDNAPKQKNYEVKKFLTGEESAGVLASAHIVISRAGANTVSEIAYLGKPAILIPIPWSSGREQEKNAKSLGEAAVIIDQKNLSGKILLEAISIIENDYEKFLSAARKNKSLVNPHAAEDIVKELKELA